MHEKLYARIDEMRGEIIKSTQELIKIRSVKGEAEPGKPFGDGVNRALEYALGLGEKLGMRTKNLDGYAGHVEIGQGEEIFGIVVHLDVVPEGKNWTYPPYAAEIHDGRMYGRGTIDDKGPAAASLYALKAVKDLGYKLNQRVRLIFGTDEESGWQGIDYYLKHEEHPDFAVSPDAEYPAINAEKGFIIFKLRRNFKATASESGLFRIKSISGGERPNIVPEYCEALIETDNGPLAEEKIRAALADSEYKLEYSREGELITLKSHGVTAHGSLPHQGQNAVSQLIVFLNGLIEPCGCGSCSCAASFIRDYAAKIGMELDGESLGCKLEDEVSGELVLNVGMLELTEEGVEATVNIRYPVTFAKDEIVESIEKSLAGTGLELEVVDYKKPLYLPADDPNVQKMMKVYNDITGENREPISFGGATYARALNKAVAFGAHFIEDPDSAHQRDEFIDLEVLIKNVKIYAGTIVELCSQGE